MFYDDIPNVADCSDVVQLYECALSVINNSKLLRDWINGSETTNVTLGGKTSPSLRQLIQNINRVAGIATSISPGAVRPDNVTTQVDALGVLSVIIGGLIENGGGLVTTSNGKLAVDFSNMPTDKFEKLLKALRLPIWLTANTSFYVDQNHAAASDTLDDGRGLSATKPFKTIQACVDYIANTYNIVNFFATIRVADGNYAPITLGDFSRTTGTIALYASNAGGAKIKRSDRGNCVVCSGGNWQLNGFDISSDLIGSSFSGRTDSYLVFCTNGSLSLSGIHGNINLSGTSASFNRLTCVSAAGGYISLGYARRQNEFGINPGVNNSSTINATFMIVNSGNSQIQLGGSNTSQSEADILISGGQTTTVECGLGLFTNSLPTTYKGRLVVKSGATVTGKRYSASNGGRIQTSGGGPDFFPGTIAGTVETATYSWYQ